jgi:hypothetical protein
METLTRIRAGTGEAVALYGDLTRLLTSLQAVLGSPEHAIGALEAYIAHPDPGSAVGKLVTELGVESGPLNELLKKNGADVLVSLFQPLRSFGAHRVAYPFARTSGPAAGVTLEGSAGLSAVVEVDTGGDLLNGMITFDGSREAIVRYGVEGTLHGGAAGGAPVGSVAVQGAFEAGATLAVDNFFRHPAGEVTLAALVGDIPHFALPGQLGGVGGIGGIGAGATLIAGQWVRINGTGSVKLGASVTWSRSFLSAADVTAKSLDVDTRIVVHTGVEATASFAYELNGTFDILVSASPVAPKVRVQLAKSQTSTRDAGLKLGVNVGIEGLDEVGRTVLGGFLPKVQALIQRIDDESARFSDLRGLFAARLSGELDSLLARQTVTDQIQDFLRTVQPDLDLRAKLKEVASEAVLGATGAQIDDMQAHLDTVTNAFKDLLRKYRAALDRIDDALQRAAHAKVGLVFARSRHEVETAEVALQFDIDPQRDGALYRRLLRGDFAAAIAASRDPATSVSDLQGALRELGAITRTSSLTFTALGKFEIDQASILSQSWETVVSPTGEITIGVHGEVQEKTKLLHETRTSTFLADAKVVGLLLDDGTVSGAVFEGKVALELTHELTPTRDNDVVAEEAALRRLGVLTDTGVSLVKDLVLRPQEPKKKFGTLVSSAFLELGRADLDALLSVSPVDAQKQLVEALFTFHPGHAWLAAEDKTGTPFLLWPSLQPLGLAGFNLTGLTGSREFRAEDGARQNIDVDALVLVRYEILLVADFRQAFSALRALRAAGPLPGESRERLLDRVRGLQKILLGNVRHMIAPPAQLDRYKISQALFLTLATLTRRHGHPAPYVSIQRKDDGKVFVYT